mmetsp:Transcript_38274/g.119495  ORF Transcript_38274/g.119495 Transcript_38274/m.119495 type:complete len:436 (+) Transcript_38274:463-1770(+)
MPHGDPHDDAVGVQDREARVLGGAEQLLHALALGHHRDALHGGLLRQDVLDAQGLRYVLGPAVRQEGEGGHVDELVVEAVVDSVPQNHGHESCHPGRSYHDGVPRDLDHHDGDGQGDPGAAAQEGGGTRKGPDAGVDPAARRQGHAVWQRSAHGGEEGCPLPGPEALLRVPAAVPPEARLDAYEQYGHHPAQHGSDDDHRQQQAGGKGRTGRERREQEEDRQKEQKHLDGQDVGRAPREQVLRGLLQRHERQRGHGVVVLRPRLLSGQVLLPARCTLGSASKAGEARPQVDGAGGVGGDLKIARLQSRQGCEVAAIGLGVPQLGNATARDELCGAGPCVAAAGRLGSGQLVGLWTQPLVVLHAVEARLGVKSQLPLRAKQRGVYRRAVHELRLPSIPDAVRAPREDAGLARGQLGEEQGQAHPAGGGRHAQDQQL